MKKILGLALVFLGLYIPFSWAEEKGEKNTSASNSKAAGGMTYSPTEGWVKTSSSQMQVGTDSLVYSAKKKASEEAEKKRIKEWAQKTAEAEAKEKLWQEKLKAAEEKRADSAAQAPARKKEKNQPAKLSAKVKTSVQQGQKVTGKSRVFVS